METKNHSASANQQRDMLFSAEITWKQQEDKFPFRKTSCKTLNISGIAESNGYFGILWGIFFFWSGCCMAQRSRCPDSLLSVSYENGVKIHITTPK